MNKKGFTLVELLMVVIIIGILVTLAVPNYYRTIERAKGAKAKATLDLVRKAELQYRLLEDEFTIVASELDAVDTAAAAAMLDVADWTYNITLDAANDGFDVTATRQGGTGLNGTIVIDEAGSITYTGELDEWK